MNKISQHQFDIWLVNLNPTTGSEQKGIRPCIILETNGVGNFSNTTIIVPLSTKLQKIFSYEVIIPANLKTGLTQKSKIKMRQIRVIDKSRLIKKIGKVPGNLFTKIRENIAIIFDLTGMFIS